MLAHLISLNILWVGTWKGSAAMAGTLIANWNPVCLTNLTGPAVSSLSRMTPKRENRANLRKELVFFHHRRLRYVVTYINYCPSIIVDDEKDKDFRLIYGYLIVYHIAHVIYNTHLYYGKGNRQGVALTGGGRVRAFTGPRLHEPDHELD